MTPFLICTGYSDTSGSYEVGTQFSKETHIRDEDDEMRKFIDMEMERLKGKDRVHPDEDSSNKVAQYLSPEDAALLSLPEHLRLDVIDISFKSYFSIL